MTRRTLLVATATVAAVWPTWQVSATAASPGSLMTADKAQLSVDDGSDLPKGLLPRRLGKVSSGSARVAARDRAQRGVLCDEACCIDAVMKVHTH